MIRKKEKEYNDRLKIWNNLEMKAQFNNDVEFVLMANCRLSLAICCSMEIDRLNEI